MILTALNLERDAVAARLINLTTHAHPEGTRFKVGSLPNTPWRVALAVIGEGNVTAGVLTERSIALFKPTAVLFVGVAGALKDDVAIGDVVMATRIYAYHSGKEDGEGFRSRPRSFETSHYLDHLARDVEAGRSWVDGPPPAVHFKPIAAGEIVLDARNSPTARHLRLHYDDAAAIDMESGGLASAGHLNRSLPVAAIRGISDTASGEKSHTDRAKWQPVAAARAAAFALALVAAMDPTSGSPQRLKDAWAKLTSLAKALSQTRWIRSRLLLALLGVAPAAAAYLAATQASDWNILGLVYALYFMIRFALLLSGFWIMGHPEPRGAAGSGIVTAIAVYFVADAIQSVRAIGTSAAWLELFAAMAFGGAVGLRLWPFPDAPRPLRLVRPTRRMLAYLTLAAAATQFALLFVAIPDHPYEQAIADGGGVIWALLAVSPVVVLCGAAALTDVAEPRQRIFTGAALVAYLGPEVYLTLGSLLLGGQSVYLGYGGWGPRAGVWFALAQTALAVIAMSSTLLLLSNRPPQGSPKQP